MACNLPAPLWVEPLRAGLQNAIDDPVTSSIELEWGAGIPVAPGESVYYNVYYALQLVDLFDEPKAFATDTKVNLPKTEASFFHFFAVRVAQLGTSSDASPANLTVLNADLFSYPDPVLLRQTFSSTDGLFADGYMEVDSVTGYPLTDGYVKIEDEIVFYSAAVDGYDGYGAFLITDRDPYGCNDFVDHIADGYLTVSLDIGKEDGNTTSFKPFPSCFLVQPTWNDPRPKYRALLSAQELGIGDTVKLTWGRADAPEGFGPIHFNIYWATSLMGLAETQMGTPQAITAEQEAIVSGIPPGDGYYFHVQAAYYTDPFSLSSLDQIGDNLWTYPDDTVVADTDGYFFEGETGLMGVEDATGFPANGIIKVGTEFMQYDLVVGDFLRIIERDVYDFFQDQDWINGTTIALHKGIEDGNDRYWRTTVTWDAGNAPRILPADGYGYYQDTDGYRAVPIDGDNLTLDLDEFESENEDFPAVEHKGFRATNFVELYSGTACAVPGTGNQRGSFIGRSPSGQGGWNIFEENLKREEFLLSLTGEKFALLRRKWTGRQCPRYTLRHEHPSARCGVCYGTGFLGGYDRYLHGRELRPGEPNPNGLIMMRVSPYENDLGLGDTRGLHQVDQIQAWLSAIPTVKDRDILIRYQLDEVTNTHFEEFRYEVLKVERNTLLLEKYGKQNVTMRKLDKTEEIYKFDVTLV